MTEILEEPDIELREIAEVHMGEGGLFVYREEVLRSTAQDLLDARLPYGLTTRYAAKANGYPGIISLFNSMGLHFDASSAQEANKLIKLGVEGSHISLSSQILRDGPALHEALNHGVLPVATTLRQLSILGNLGVRSLAVRINPDVEWAGGNHRTSVGGVSSSFGIWHEQLDDVVSTASVNGQTIDRLHTHIGSGVKPEIWRSVIQKSLEIVEELPDVRTLDIGGGYKVARMPGELHTDMSNVFGIFSEELEKFANKTGREIALEIEPGTHLVANAGILLGRIEEAVHTGASGYNFLKLNVGMNAIMRPSLYGAQHPIWVLNDSEKLLPYVVVGPCCESGDILTPKKDDPETIEPRLLRVARVGDFVGIGGAGAYCASMSAKQYNDVPETSEIMIAA